MLDRGLARCRMADERVRGVYDRRRSRSILRGVAADRMQLTDEHGRPVLDCVAGTREGRPWARDVVVRAPGAVDRVLADLAGWLLTGPTELAFALVARGATLRRHAHIMTLDLAGWSAPDLPVPAGVRFVPCDRPAADLLAAHLA